MHCFTEVRSRNCVPFKDGKPPSVYPLSEQGLNVRLVNPGVNWADLASLKEKYFESFKASLDECLEECFAKKNLRLRYCIVVLTSL